MKSTSVGTVRLGLLAAVCTLIGGALWAAQGEKKLNLPIAPGTIPADV